MSVSQCAYLMSVFRLECLRIEYSDEMEAFHKIFQYLEDYTIRMDKSEMWTCIMQVAVQVFQRYLQRLSSMLAIVDNVQDRQQILSDFVKRCTSVIEEGLKWAPHLVRSHLAEYTLQREHSWQGLRHHTGLAFASELVFNYAGAHRSGTCLGPAALDKRPNCAKRDYSNFLCTLTLRSRFLGQVGGDCISPLVGIAFRFIL
ncbi:unnamed protein product [Dibothriocephalus latus]|uniref:Uncharacterized protein n=1 Tax=Dibothriocephalus latus TaxID=60516 RepID=A0A3P7L8H4_DIBLA|nr:unnamed protein product [Dibothriocephalus latus]